METKTITLLATWLLTIALHGGALLLMAWAIDSTFRSLRGTWRELLWRTALFGCVLTATLQLVSPLSPLTGRWHFSQAAQTAPSAGIDPIAPMNFSAVALPKSQSSTTPETTHAAAATASADTGSPLAAANRNSWSAHWLAWIIGLWASGVLVAIVHLSIRYARMRRLLENAAAIANPDLAADLAILATQAQINAPRLLHLDGIFSPLAAPGSRIVLPTWAIETLDRRQLQAMLAHELAHIARGDPTWKLLAALWRALFWFVPFGVVAQRRLDEIAELSCDAFAAQHTGDGRRVAECLAACAEHHMRGPVFDLAPAMAARQSSLLNRIERLLEGVSMETSYPGACSRLVALVALVASAVCLPAIGFDSVVAHAAETPQKQQSAAKHDTQNHSSVSIDDDDHGHQTMSISTSDDEHKFSAKVDGKLVLNADETDIAGLGNGGTATFSETRAGVTRRIEMSESAGKLERHYFVGNAEKTFDDGARAWMATAVTELARSGFGAEMRVKRLYQNGGAKRVLDEIGHINTDYVRGIYLKSLAEMGPLAPGELDRALEFCGTMSSDYERGQSLGMLFDRQTLNATQQITFLQQAKHFDSDYERAQLLVATIPKLANTPEVSKAWLDAALGIGSDYEHSRTLQAMLDSSRLDDAQLLRVIEASSSISSDYEHRELLLATLKHASKIDALAPAYIHSAQSLGSGYEHREALLALIKAGPLGTNTAGALLDSAASIDSSDDLREVLESLAHVMPNDAALIRHYHQVAAQLSEYDRQQADHALPQVVQ